MDALVFTGGDGPEAAFLLSLAQRSSLTVAADSGLSLALDAGIRPDWLVGDMDSLKDMALLDLFPADRILRYPVAKDLTDTELAIELARAQGACRILIAGGGGGRLDHSLAMRALFERPGPPAEWHTARESVFFVAAGAMLGLEAPPATVVSVFPLSGGASGMSSSGLVWPLDGLCWGPGEYGISNICKENSFEVRAGQGALLVIVARQSQQH